MHTDDNTHIFLFKRSHMLVHTYKRSQMQMKERLWRTLQGQKKKKNPYSKALSNKRLCLKSLQSTERLSALMKGQRHRDASESERKMLKEP